MKGMFLETTTVGEAVSALKAQAIYGISFDVHLGKIPQIPLLLCFRANIIWNGISYISINQVPPINCRPEDQRFVRSIIDTPGGPSFWYQRQQKLCITIDGEKVEYALTGNVTLEWVEGWFKRTARCDSEIEFFSGGVPIDRAEEQRFAFDVPNLGVKETIVKCGWGRELMGSVDEDLCEMMLWNDRIEGLIVDLPV
jgi:hypothetical protein